MFNNSENMTHVFELTISKKMLIPMNLIAKLMSQASLNSEKENHFSIQTMTNDWGIKNPIYQDLMEFLATSDKDEFSYFQLGKNRSQPVMIGNLQKFNNSLHLSFLEGE